MSTVFTYVSNFFSICVVAVIAWAFKTESKINVLAQQYIDMKELINARFDASDDRMERIETRIEKVLNGRSDREST